MNLTKNTKIKAFYVDVVKMKPDTYKYKRYIHSEGSQGFWCSIRDISAKEKLNYETKANEVVVKITIGHNPKIIENWEKLILVDVKNNTYRIKSKPDEFDYQSQDMVITAYRFVDTEIYGGETYGN